eukprot:TRINITY_DN22609_c0_g1_i1.p1 TRINITY_DN22609_c0_g1~~TRINITY_DN22609_c0_g1_i1.p1  ORF type:complete len:438 (-),score=82.80 TRINITY_DN22609_c0_g1_i1:527-1654(-)
MASATSAAASSKEPLTQADRSPRERCKQEAFSQTPQEIDFGGRVLPLRSEITDAEVLPKSAPPGSASVPPVLPNCAIYGLTGEEVWLDESDGSLEGAALWLSMRPSKASKIFLQTFDICLPWAEDIPPLRSPAVEGRVREVATSPMFKDRQLLLSPARSVRSMESPVELSAGKRNESFFQEQDSHGGSRASSPETPLQRERRKISFDSDGNENDELTPEQVLRRLSGLMSEMTAMEASLGNLREDLERDTCEPSKVPLASTKAAATKIQSNDQPHDALAEALPTIQRPPSRLRSRLPESLSWLEDLGTTNRPSRHPIAPRPRPQPQQRRSLPPRRPGNFAASTTPLGHEIAKMTRAGSRIASTRTRSASRWSSNR